MFELGDRVRIITYGRTGYICDVSRFENRIIYIVDCFGECDSESVADFVISVEESEIEAST